jgi:hypothetical protein
MKDLFQGRHGSAPRPRRLCVQFSRVGRGSHRTAFPSPFAPWVSCCMPSQSTGRQKGRVTRPFCCDDVAMIGLCSRQPSNSAAFRAKVKSRTSAGSSADTLSANIDRFCWRSWLVPVFCSRKRPPNASKSRTSSTRSERPIARSGRFRNRGSDGAECGTECGIGHQTLIELPAFLRISEYSAVPLMAQHWQFHLL